MHQAAAPQALPVTPLSACRPQQQVRTRRCWPAQCLLQQLEHMQRLQALPVCLLHMPALVLRMLRVLLHHLVSGLPH